MDEDCLENQEETDEAETGPSRPNFVTDDDDVNVVVSAWR
jgi:hypothetical protein